MVDKMSFKGENYDVTEIYEKNKAWFKITEIEITIKRKKRCVILYIMIIILNLHQSLILLAFLISLTILHKELTWCTGDKLELTPDFIDATYVSQDGSEYPAYHVTQPGLYYVTVSNS
jgi:hypothetical protein